MEIFEGGMLISTLPTTTFTVTPVGDFPDGHVVKGVATDCQLSYTTLRVRIPTEASEKVASDLGLGAGFLPDTSVSSTSYKKC